MYKKNTGVMTPVPPRFSAVCLQVIHNLKPRVCGQVCRYSSFPDVAEGLPPAASVSRPVGYGTGGFSAQARRR
uniref:Uncharacterized protein n=1 Tax=Klebsiella pneumoniae TaxID=573 RepID=A0A6M3HEN6_KLEPN|nr:hypothetical protein [Klebsiella pneumoniae]QJS02664.1 hypothetical protein [Klebsiella pneumoniae]